jgi:sulfur-oxidizing protein SoxY
MTNKEPHNTIRFSRREAMLFGASGLAFVALSKGAWAQAAMQAWERLGAARKIVGDAQPLSDGLILELPLISEDGSSVPLTVRAQSPMTDDCFIQSIHLFATRNPSPEIAEFEFSPQMGLAQIGTRIRLSETQTVIAVARTNKNAVLTAAREVRITTSGCLVRADSDDSAQEMQARVRVPAKVQAGVPAEVLTLINHPMETGLREDGNGKVLPQRIIRSFDATLDDKPVLKARLHRSLAANPYLRFYVAPKASGEIVFKWIEDTGRVAERSATIVVG